MTEKLTILHLNDWHSHFETYPKIKRFFQDYPKESEVIRVDVGDNIDRWHPMTDVTQGKFNVQLMNELGIDFATIGNNEGIGLAKKMLNQVYDTADFDVILGNLEDESGRPRWASPYKIYETDAGTKLAFLAYTFPYELTYKPGGWQVLDPIACLKRDLELPEVKAADFHILLSHLGLPFDEKITAEVPEIDLIIGAHTHHVFEDGACLNGTYLAAAGKYGQFVGEINLTFDEHELSDITIHAHETSHMSSKPGDKEWIEKVEDDGRTLLSQQLVTYFDRDLTLEESCQLVMEAMKDYAKADIAMINSGLVVTPFSKKITRDTLHHSLPHQMRLARLEVTIDDLTTICRDVFSQAKLLANQQIRGMGFRGKEFGTVLTSGFDYKNGKIVYNKKVTNEKDTISLVLVDQYYFARYFETIKSHQAELLFPELLRELVETYLKNNMKFYDGLREETDEKRYLS